MKIMMVKSSNIYKIPKERHLTIKEQGDFMSSW